TIKRASYRFSDRVAIDIRPFNEGVECVIEACSDTVGVDIESVVRDFRIEVLDQDLRATISEETAQIRNAILGYAFSKTGLQGGE
ncbi:hypothetical protein ABTE34_20170, partial [Acinetobacter baumannii]